MSEEIDSTTISHSEDNEVPLFGVHHNGHELVPGNHSTNNQKRKFSEDDGNSNPESSSDESKKQRTNESNYNNAMASVSDSALRTNGDNVNRNEDEATGGEPAEEPRAGISIKQEIKEEPQDDNEAESTSSPNEFCDIKLEVKTEASDESENPTAEEATSSIRDSCQYGIKCYRIMSTPKEFSEYGKHSATTPHGDRDALPSNISYNLPLEGPLPLTTEQKVEIPQKKKRGGRYLYLRREIQHLKAILNSDEPSTCDQNLMLRQQIHELQQELNTKRKTNRNMAKNTISNLPLLPLTTEQKVEIPQKKKRGGRYSYLRREIQRLKALLNRDEPSTCDQNLMLRQQIHELQQELNTKRKINKNKAKNTISDLPLPLLPPTTEQEVEIPQKKKRGGRYSYLRREIHRLKAILNSDEPSTWDQNLMLRQQMHELQQELNTKRKTNKNKAKLLYQI